MKKIKYLLLVAFTAVFMSCGNGGYDANKVDELYSKALNGQLEQTDYPLVVEQAKAIIAVLKDKFSPEELKNAELKPFDEKEAFYGADYETYKDMNCMLNALYGQEEKMDEPTQKAYEELKQEKKELFGL